MKLSDTINHYNTDVSIWQHFVKMVEKNIEVPFRVKVNGQITTRLKTIEISAKQTRAFRSLSQSIEYSDGDLTKQGFVNYCRSNKVLTTDKKERSIATVDWKKIQEDVKSQIRLTYKKQKPSIIKNKAKSVVKTSRNRSEAASARGSDGLRDELFAYIMLAMRSIRSTRAEDYTFEKVNEIVQSKSNMIKCTHTLEECWNEERIDLGLMVGKKLIDNNIYRSNHVIWSDKFGSKSGNIVNEIYKPWKDLYRKGEEQEYLNDLGSKLKDDKWTPADLWFIDTSYKHNKKFNDIFELRQEMLELLVSKKVVGLSLKDPQRGYDRGSLGSSFLSFVGANGGASTTKKNKYRIDRINLHAKSNRTLFSNSTPTLWFYDGKSLNEMDFRMNKGKAAGYYVRNNMGFKNPDNGGSGSFTWTHLLNQYLNKGFDDYTKEAEQIYNDMMNNNKESRRNHSPFDDFMKIVNKYTNLSKQEVLASAQDESPKKVKQKILTILLVDTIKENPILLERIGNVLSNNTSWQPPYIKSW